MNTDKIKWKTAIRSFLRQIGVIPYVEDLSGENWRHMLQQQYNWNDCHFPHNQWKKKKYIYNIFDFSFLWIKCYIDNSNISVWRRGLERTALYFFNQSVVTPLCSLFWVTLCLIKVNPTQGLVTSWSNFCVLILFKQFTALTWLSRNTWVVMSNFNHCFE